jgi:hypothetical protein
MWGIVGQLTALKAREGMGASGGGEGMEWAVVDEEGLRRLTGVSPLLLVLFICYAFWAFPSFLHRAVGTRDSPLSSSFMFGLCTARRKSYSSPLRNDETVHWLTSPQLLQLFLFLDPVRTAAWPRAFDQDPSRWSTRLIRHSQSTSAWWSSRQCFITG